MGFSRNTNFFTQDKNDTFYLHPSVYTGKRENVRIIKRGKRQKRKGKEGSFEQNKLKINFLKNNNLYNIHGFLVLFSYTFNFITKISILRTFVMGTILLKRSVESSGDVRVESL